jgi:hypothetical protein
MRDIDEMIDFTGVVAVIETFCASEALRASGRDRRVAPDQRIRRGPS